MGRKYSSIHIIAGERSISKDYAYKIYCELSGRIESKADTDGFAILVEVAKQLLFGEDSGDAACVSVKGDAVKSLSAKLNECAALTAPDVHIVSTDVGVSIYDDALGFEGIGSMAKDLSARVQGHILYSAVFDDDVFVFGICKDGKLLSEHVSGECDTYGINKSQMQLEHIAQALGCREEDLSDYSAELEGEEFESFLHRHVHIDFSM